MEAIQGLQTKDDKISALEEELSQMTTNCAKFKAELDTERALMAEVFRQSPAGIIVMDAQSGKAIRVNMMAKKIIGSESVISRSVEDHNSAEMSVLFHLDGTPCELKEMPLMRSALNSEIVTNEELIFNRMDGLQGVLNVSSGPIFDCNGKVIAAVTTFHDVTRMGYK
jgi:PAS domain S-box-containing protein